MDLKTVLTTLTGKFEVQKIRYGLMGGFALGLWGVARATVDLDFLIDRRDLQKVDEIMKALGYSVKFSSENVTQYTSPVALFGEVDYLHAFRDASMGMLARTVTKEAFSGALQVRVIAPEDLIGLKLQAIRNNPARRALDMSDIRALVAVRAEQLDWTSVERYGALLDAQDLLKEIRQ